jgi:hypothetical protein
LVVPDLVSQKAACPAFTAADKLAAAFLIAPEYRPFARTLRMSRENQTGILNQHLPCRKVPWSG